MSLTLEPRRRQHTVSLVGLGMLVLARCLHEKDKAHALVRWVGCAALSSTHLLLLPSDAGAQEL